MKKLIVELSDHEYENIITLAAVNIGRGGRFPYKGIVMYALNAIRRAEIIDDKAADEEATTKNNIAQERFQDLIEYFSDEKVAKTILSSRKEFKAWLKRLKWHVKRADELARVFEDSVVRQLEEEADYAYADFEEYKKEVLGADFDELPDDDFRYGLKRGIEIIKAAVRSEREKDEA